MKAELQIPFKSTSEARSALKVLESEKVERDRSQAKLSVTGSVLRVAVSAADLPALRASVGTYLRLLSVIIAGTEAEG